MLGLLGFFLFLFSVVAIRLLIYKYFLEDTLERTDEDLYEELQKLFAFRKEKEIYLASSEWREKRKEVLFRANYLCESCNTKKKLHIHHTSGYNLIPNEPITCLVALCSKCHKLQHDHYGYPQTYNEYMEWNAPLIKEKYA